MPHAICPKLCGKAQLNCPGILADMLMKSCIGRNADADGCVGQCLTCCDCRCVYDGKIRVME